MDGDNEFPFWLDGQPKPANESEMNQSLFYLPGPGYLKAMAIPLRRGHFSLRTITSIRLTSW